jgi:hypothetical protein
MMGKSKFERILGNIWEDASLEDKVSDVNVALGVCPHDGLVQAFLHDAPLQRKVKEALEAVEIQEARELQEID